LDLTPYLPLDITDFRGKRLILFRKDETTLPNVEKLNFWFWSFFGDFNVEKRFKIDFLSFRRILRAGDGPALLKRPSFRTPPMDFKGFFVLTEILRFFDPCALYLKAALTLHSSVCMGRSQMVNFHYVFTLVGTSGTLYHEFEYLLVTIYMYDSLQFLIEILKNLRLSKNFAWN